MNFIFNSEIIDYNYIDNKKDRNLIFLHGWGGNKFSFQSTIKMLKNFNILTITMPTISPTKKVWTMETYRDLVLNLTRLLNISSAVIVCHSFGFRVASMLNGLFDIEKVVVTGGAGLKRTNRLKQIENENNIILLRQVRFKYLYKSLASKDYIALSDTNKRTFNQVVNCVTTPLIRFTCPMLLFWGKSDHETPLWMAKKIKKKNDAKLILTGSGHFAYIDYNAEFNHEVVRFLNDIHS